MLEYIIIAFSFSLSSLWFIHKKGLEKENIKKYPFGYDIAFVIIATIAFPVFLLAWLGSTKEFEKGYREALAKLIREGK